MAGERARRDDDQSSALRQDVERVPQFALGGTLARQLADVFEHQQSQAAIAIHPDETAGILTVRLSHHGANLLAETLPRWLAGAIAPQPQDNGLATLCRPVRKEQGIVDWSRPAVEIARAVRAYNPWPGASSTWNGLPLKVVQAGALAGDPAAELPGLVLERQGATVVVTGEGFLRLDIVQLAGRNPTSIDDFVRGQRGFAGSVLGRYP